MKEIYILSSNEHPLRSGTDDSLGIAITSEVQALGYVEGCPVGKKRGFQKATVFGSLEEALRTLEPGYTMQLPTVFGGAPVTAELGVPVEAALKSKPFLDWVASMDTSYFKVKRVHLQSVDMFGPRVGFIKFKADVVDPRGQFKPGIVFMRGGTVSMIDVFLCEGIYYVGLTVQARFPTGCSRFVEIPAGVIDGDGAFSGDAARELKEEMGITISEKDLTDISALLGNRGTFLSPGGSNEIMRFLGFCWHVSRADLRKMRGRHTGEAAEGEEITTKISPLEAIWKLPDVKTAAAYTYFTKVKDQIPVIDHRWLRHC